MKRWLIGAAVAAALLLLAYAGWQSNVAGRLRADYEAFKARRSAVEAEAGKVLGEVAAKDAAIRGMSQEIVTLTARADAARKRAADAEARAGAYAGRAADLAETVRRLEVAAAARGPVETRAAAVRALGELGYPGP